LETFIIVFFLYNIFNGDVSLIFPPKKRLRIKKRRKIRKTHILVYCNDLKLRQARSRKVWGSCRLPGDGQTTLTWLGATHAPPHSFIVGWGRPSHGVV
jgi:hypothetical protein